MILFSVAALLHGLVAYSPAHARVSQFALTGTLPSIQARSSRRRSQLARATVPSGSFNEAEVDATVYGLYHHHEHLSGGTEPRLRQDPLRSTRDVDVLPSAEAIPSVAYNPHRSAEQFALQPMAVSVRHLQLLGPLLTFLGKVLFDVQRGDEQTRRPQRAAELTRLISSLGPAIIKAGQALSSRSDLLPAEYLKELQKLQDRVPPIDNDEGEPCTSRAHVLAQAYLSRGFSPMSPPMV